MRKLNLKIEASALSYAIMFVLMTALLSGAIFAIFSTNQRQIFHFSEKENLLFNSKAAIQYALVNDKWNNDSSIVLHPSGDTSVINRINWGLYQVFRVRTFKGNYKIQSYFFAGKSAGNSLPALVLSSGNDGLKITGKTLLEGVFYTPGKRIERSYIAGKNFEYDDLYHGSNLDVASLKWMLRPEITELNFEKLTEGILPNSYPYRTTECNFFDPTKLFSELTPIDIHEQLTGHIIVRSMDSIHISNEAKLEQICLIAPIIHIEKGFQGNVQLYATQKIIIEDSVKLNYPSSLFLYGESSTPNTSPLISIGKKSVVIGSILALAKDHNFRYPPIIRIAEKSKACGLIYNSGKTELYGSVYGNLFTNQFEIQAGGGTYVNNLADVTISSLSVPKKMGIPYILDLQKNISNVIVSCGYLN